MYRLALVSILLFTADFALAQRTYPKKGRHPFKQYVKVREKYKVRALPNKLTLNIFGLFFAHDCVSPAFGLEYERFLKKESPLSISLAGYFYFGSTFALVTRQGDVRSDITGWYVMPTAMYHFFGHSRRIDLSAGPGLLVGSMQRHDRQAGMPPNPRPEHNFKRIDMLSAAMLQVNMTLHSNRSVVFATHLDVGAIIDAGPTKGVLVNIGIKLGHRF